MSEKKMIGRNVAIALGIMCVILAVGLVGAITNYTSIINNKDTIHQDYVSTHSNTNSEFNSLNSSYYDYMGTHSHTDSEYDALQSNYDSVIAPKLIKVHLISDDNRPWFATPYLHVYGYVCNVGTYIAYSSKIHVVAYQSGGVVAIDTYITLGTIYGESWTSVDSNIYYSGSALTSWSLTLEWAS